MSATRIETSLAPWLAVSDGAKALAFYQAALGAVDVYRLDGDDGKVIVAQLNVDGATFWVQEDPENSPQPRDGRAARSVRLILTVDDPDASFQRAIAAGATQIAPVHDAHGWRTGRVADPFGHDWEFSKPSAAP